MGIKRLSLLILLAVALPGFGVKADTMPGDTLNVTYKLHGQTRRFKFVYEPDTQGGLTLHWSIARNLKLWTGTYTMRPSSVENGNSQSWVMPEDGNNITLSPDETFAIISRKALADLKRDGKFVYNGILWKKKAVTDTSIGKAIVVEDPEESAAMTILNNPELPLIVSMSDNPLEIDWIFY